jgi:hypothetical protein
MNQKILKMKADLEMDESLGFSSMRERHAKCPWLKPLDSEQFRGLKAPAPSGTA